MKTLTVIVSLIAAPAMACWLTFEGTLRCPAAALELWSCGGGDGIAQRETAAGFATDRDTLYKAEWLGHRNVRTFLGVVREIDVSECKAEWKGIS